MKQTVHNWSFDDDFNCVTSCRSRLSYDAGRTGQGSAYATDSVPCLTNRSFGSRFTRSCEPAVALIQTLFSDTLTIAYDTYFSEPQTLGTNKSVFCLRSAKISILLLMKRRRDAGYMKERD